MAIEEMVGIGRDHPFGQVERLDEEEPPEIARRKLAVRLRIHRRCRRDVEQDEPRDTVWMVERHAMRDARAAIMRDNVEPVEPRSEEHTSELQSLMRISYAVFCLKKKNNITTHMMTQPENHTK